MAVTNTDSHKEKEKPKKPDYLGVIAANFVWLMTIAGLFMVNRDLWAFATAVSAGALIISGFWCKSFRSGLSGTWNGLIPIWGIVARYDRINTCRRLRKAGVYTAEDESQTIPATTYQDDYGETVVRFNGNGQPGMTVKRVAALFADNASIWGCRSSRVDVDPEKPYIFTVHLSKAIRPHSSLDDDLNGVVG